MSQQKTLLKPASWRSAQPYIPKRPHPYNLRGNKICEVLEGLIRGIYKHGGQGVERGAPRYGELHGRF